MVLSLFASQGCTAARVVRRVAGIAYKTFTVPLAGLHRATLMTLEHMDITVSEDRETRDGRQIHAKAGSRNVEIKLDKLTSRATRMRVVAKKSWLVRDRATATEIILQTEQTLIDNPHLIATGSEAHPGGLRVTDAITRGLRTVIGTLSPPQRTGRQPMGWQEFQANG
ncbi:MAG: hypothetical protein ACE5NC_12975 [Anaerolineae bacterium]